MQTLFESKPRRKGACCHIAHNYLEWNDFHFADQLLAHVHAANEMRWHANGVQLAEDKFGNLFFNFAVLAIFISCLGLLGLASYSTIQRTREIGVRKVLGASVSNIVNLLSLEFIKLVLIAFVIAAPIGLFGMNKWLQDFAYHIHISWWVFVVAGSSSIVIAFLTISFQAIKAAVANPVHSLRSE